MPKFCFQKLAELDQTPSVNANRRLALADDQACRSLCWLCWLESRLRSWRPSGRPVAADVLCCCWLRWPCWPGWVVLGGVCESDSIICRLVCWCMVRA